MPFDVQFNTGRPYTARGQLIRAKAVEGGAIFADFDRCITGYVNLEPCFTERDFRTAVLREYDACNYSWDLRAMDLRPLHRCDY